jgi:hypothetical protein
MPSSFCRRLGAGASASWLEDEVGHGMHLLDDRHVRPQILRPRTAAVRMRHVEE